MPDKLVIDIFRKKSIEDFSALFSSSTAVPETGSASALTASISPAFLKRAAEALCTEYKDQSAKEDEASELSYIIRNAEIVRNYMAYLVDEDVKCRGPIKKARLDGDPQKIEACIQPACAINAEIVNMMLNLLELCTRLNTLYPKNKCHYLTEAAECAMCSIKLSVSFIYSMLDFSTDDTYVYVTKRENEIALENAERIVKALLNNSGLPFEV